MARTPQTVWLQPHQIGFINLLLAEGPDAATSIGIGGPRGGAKSHSMRSGAMAVAEVYPGSRSFIIRKNWTDIYENHFLKFAQEYPGINELYNGQHKEYTFPNKSTLAYKFADTEREIEQLVRGPEGMFLFVDQAEQFPEKGLKMIKTANRWKGAPVGRCKVAHGFNPGGPGNEYLKRIYYTRQFQETETATTYQFLRMNGWDNWEWFRNAGLYANAEEFYRAPDEERFQNFIRSTDYGRNLWEKPESIRLGELYGSFDHFAGQYYGGVWDESVHVLRLNHAEAIIQPWWKKWLAIDWGFAHNAACGWFAAGRLQPLQAEKLLGIAITKAIDVVICCQEFVTSEMAEGEFARQIVERTPKDERKQLTRCFLSPETFGVRGSAHAITGVLQQFGLPTPEPAANQRVTRGVGRDGERIGGWRLLHNMLRQSVRFSEKVIEEQAYGGGPAFLVSEACPAVCDAIPALMRDEDNPEDVRKIDSRADDVGDMVRYGMTEYLSPNAVPVADRRRELYDSIQGSDDLAMTHRAMAMRQFEVGAVRKRIGARSWRG